MNTDTDTTSNIYSNSNSNSNATFSAEHVLHWVHQELLPSTSQLRSSSTFQFLQASLFLFCFIIVPWATFISTLCNKTKSTMATEKDVTATLVESGNELKKQDALSDKGEALPAVLKNASEDKEEEERSEDEDVMQGDMAPLHFNILRSPARLRGASRPSTSRSSSFSRSRSASPVPAHGQCSHSSSRDVMGEAGGEKGGGGIINSTVSRSSSDHSLGSSSVLSQCSNVDKHGHQHIITEDMLTDRLGFEEVVPPHHSPHASCTTLPSVNERMSEESLDDCHAFSDVKVPRRMSWGSDRGSVQGSAGGEAGSCSNSVLGTLEEEDGSSSDEGDDGEEVMVTGEAGESEANPNILAAVASPERTKEEETKIMFEMLDLVSTDEERRRLLLEDEKKVAALETQNPNAPAS
jgi:hypothetical protein